MNRTMRKLTWLTLCCLLYHSTEVLCFSARASTDEDVSSSETSVSRKLQAANMDMHDDVEARDTRPMIIAAAPLKECEHLNITGGFRPRRIREIHSKDFSFFFRRKENFVRLIIQPQMHNVLEGVDDIIEFRSQDLEDPLEEWVEVRVHYFQQDIPWRLDSHALQVTVGNAVRSKVTKYWSVLYVFEGFLLSAEGGLEVIFNCSPNEYFVKVVPPPHPASSSWMWLLAGCLMSLMLVLVALICILMATKQPEQQQQDVSSPPNSLVYEEFDEEMLARIRKKVEALREGRASESSDSDVKENHYVVHMTPTKTSIIPTNVKQGGEGPCQRHHEISKSINTGRSMQRLLSSESYMDSQLYLDENQYETVFPLDNSALLSREVPEDQASDADVVSNTEVMLPDKDDVTYEDIYEHMYMTA